MKFYQSDLCKLFVFEIFAAIIVAMGAVDRIFSYVPLALMIAFFLTKPFRQSLQLFLMSVPLYIALPISPGFDQISVWRPLSLLLAILWLWERRSIWWSNPLVFWEAFWQRKGLLYLTIAWGAFLFIATISLAWAAEWGAGVKSIIYFANIFVVLFIYAWETNDERDARLWLQRAALAHGFVLLVGFLQFFSTFFISLFEFWQWWAAHPIAVYYGDITSTLVSYSNTWFSYYGSEEIPATLRMFSLFQDSHAFAMFCLLGIGLWGAWFLWFDHQQDKKGAGLSVGLIAVNELAIILSGSRGAWAGALLLVALIAFVMAGRMFKSVSRDFLKKGFASLVMFFLLFPISTVLLAYEQQAQLRIEGKAGAFNLSLAFWRARSTFDINELSNKGRLEIWHDSYYFLKERAFLSGTGIGNFSTVLALRPDTARLGASAHSLYLQFLVELGIFGLLAFLSILLLIMYQAYQLIKTVRDSFVHFYAFAFLFAFAWVLLYSLVDVTLLNDKVLLFTAIFIGIVYGNYIKKPATK